MSDRAKALPRKRSEHLVEVELADEVVIYDQRTTAAHALNGPAALVWKSLDGEITIKELSRRLRNAFGGAETDESAWLALKDLAKRDLLDGRLPAAETRGVSRRQVMKRLALTGVALPAIITLATPNAAEAAGTGLACTTVGCLTACPSPTGGCCVCITTTENRNMCVQPNPCLTSCVNSAGCPAGQVCVQSPCCQTPVCAVVCTPSTVCPAGTFAAPTGWGGGRR